ncbi:kinase-like domain-containing protein [Pavlovales sp. CCMP2436]|nr:kinase-like domain-containing protein [Pavlovales sp. CCMP2436]
MSLSLEALQRALPGDLAGKEVLIYTGPGKGARARVFRCQGSDLVLEASAALQLAAADNVLVLPVAASTEAYFRQHVVVFDQPVGEGFLDPGRGAAGVLPSPEALSRMRAVASGVREVLLVDARVDKSLRAFVVDAIARASRITDTRERIKLLGELVSERLGGVSSSIVDYCEEELAALMRDKDSPIVKLGDVNFGVCRHRALLFKVLCDALGLSCALVRGNFGGAQGAGAHAWNVVHVYGSTYVVDVMHRPGEIYAPDDVRCASYHRLAERGGGGDAHHGAGLKSLPPPAPREEWYVRPADVQMERGRDGGDVVLGSGGFGTVYAARHKGARRVAVKRLNAAGAAAASKEFAREVDMLHRLKHEHIIIFVGACDDPGNLMIVTELMEGKSLADVLERDPASPPVVHWDVKPANVLCQSGLGLFKLADVGLAANMSCSQARAAGWTPSYAAPEVLLGRPTNAKADVFSFGVLVEALLAGRQPTGRGSARLPPATPPQARRLVLVCLSEEAALRPSAVDLVNGLEDDAGPHAEAEAAAAAAVAQAEEVNKARRLADAAAVHVKAQAEAAEKAKLKAEADLKAEAKRKAEAKLKAEAKRKAGTKRKAGAEAEDARCLSMLAAPVLDGGHAERR